MLELLKRSESETFTDRLLKPPTERELLGLGLGGLTIAVATRDRWVPKAKETVGDAIHGLRLRLTALPETYVKPEDNRMQDNGISEAESTKEQKVGV